MKKTTPKHPMLESQPIQMTPNHSSVTDQECLTVFGDIMIEQILNTIFNDKENLKKKIVSDGVNFKFTLNMNTETPIETVRNFILSENGPKSSSTPSI